MDIVFLSTRYLNNVKQNVCVPQFMRDEFVKRACQESAVPVCEIITFVARDIIELKNVKKYNHKTYNDKSFEKTMIYVNYICEDLQITDNNDLKYPDPNKIMKKYLKQPQIITQRMIMVDLPNCFLVLPMQLIKKH